MSQKLTDTETSSKDKSATDLAEEFLAYCKANPSQRFWQALLNWSQLPYILVSARPIFSAKGRDNKLIDPYYWKDKNEFRL